MPIITLLRIYVLALQGIGVRSAVSEEQRRCALERLKEMTGQDFGYDAMKWDEWLSKNMSDEYFACNLQQS